MNVGESVNGWSLAQIDSRGFRHWNDGAGAALIVSSMSPWFNGPPRVQMAGGTLGHALHRWQKDPTYLGYRCSNCGQFEAETGAALPLTGCGPYDLGEADLPAPTPLRPESHCPTCRTLLWDDEPTCWKCGWHRP